MAHLESVLFVVRSASNVPESLRLAFLQRGHGHGGMQQHSPPRHCRSSSMEVPQSGGPLFGRHLKGRPKDLVFGRPI